MIAEVHKFEDYDLTIDYYKSTINHWSKCGNSNNNDKWINAINLTPTVALMIITNNISETFTRCDSIIDDYLKEHHKEENSIRCYNLLNAIRTKRFKIKKHPLYSIELFHQIRNVLAHLNYRPFLNPAYIGGSTIFAENDFIKGNISLSEFEELASKYEQVKNKLTTNNKLRCPKSSNTGISIISRNLKNSDLKRVLSYMKEGVTKDGKERILTIDGQFENSYELGSLKPISADEKELIINYINYCGLDRWNSATDKKIEALYYLHFYAVQNKAVENMAFHNYSIHAMFGKHNKEMEILAPFIFYSQVLQYSYFCLNILKETAKVESLERQIFENANLDEINVIDYRDEVEQETIRQEKESISSTITDYERKIKELELQIININKKTTLSPEKKQSIILPIKEIIDRIKNDIIKLREKLKFINKKSKFLNTSKFYDRLRNSISHNRIEIDYNSGLKTGNLYDTIITFYDLNEKKTSERTFEFKITVRELLKMYDKIMTEVKRNSEFYQTEITKIGIIKNSSSYTETMARDFFAKKISELQEGTNHTYKPVDIITSGTKK